MSKLFDEAKDIIGLERDLNLNDYKRFKEIEKIIPENEERNFAWLLEALEIRLPEIAQKEGNYDWIEPEDED
tara:strand:+ start:993 stop:1208 length:216 start_codon:yes stop_codon:yes gene_type:complete